LKRRILTPLAGVALLAIPAFALAATSPTTKVKLANVGAPFGKIAVKGNSFTLYIFTKDKAKQDNCWGRKQFGQKCQSIWPPYIKKGKLVAGTGITASKLGSIKLPNGKRQVTYYGHPLYGYSGDFGPKETSYIGQSQFGGFWYAINGSGKAVK
jgi:predicted lipoprotein with Yx(FWY)xxD motif